MAFKRKKKRSSRRKRRSKTNKRAKRSKRVAKRGFRGRARRIGRGLGMSLKAGWIGNGLKGVGGGVAAEAILDRTVPQYSEIGGYVGSYFTGGIAGVLGHVIRKVATGGSIGFGTVGQSSVGAL